MLFVVLLQRDAFALPGRGCAGPFRGRSGVGSVRARSRNVPCVGSASSSPAGPRARPGFIRGLLSLFLAFLLQFNAFSSSTRGEDEDTSCRAASRCLSRATKAAVVALGCEKRCISLGPPLPAPVGAEQARPRRLWPSAVPAWLKGMITLHLVAASRMGGDIEGAAVGGVLPALILHQGLWPQ